MRHATLQCAMQHCNAPCNAAMRHATPQCAMQRRNAPCNAAMRHATPQCAMQHRNAPCNTTMRHATRSVRRAACKPAAMTLPHAVIAQPHAAAQQRRRSRSRSTQPQPQPQHAELNCNTGLDSPLPTSAPGLGSPLPHLHRDWTRPLPQALLLGLGLAPPRRTARPVERNRDARVACAHGALATRSALRQGVCGR